MRESAARGEKEVGKESGNEGNGDIIIEEGKEFNGGTGKGDEKEWKESRPGGKDRCWGVGKSLEPEEEAGGSEGSGDDEGNGSRDGFLRGEGPFICLAEAPTCGVTLKESQETDVPAISATPSPTAI